MTYEIYSIHSKNNYVLPLYLPDIVLGTRDISVNKTEKVCGPKKPAFSVKTYS